jgi:hypothetical protein
VLPAHNLRADQQRACHSILLLLLLLLLPVQCSWGCIPILALAVCL